MNVVHIVLVEHNVETEIEVYAQIDEALEAASNHAKELAERFGWEEDIKGHGHYNQLNSDKGWCGPWIEVRSPEVMEKETEAQRVHAIELDVRHVLRGETDYLAWAFRWGQTPQGRDHWRAIHAGREQLSPDDMKYLTSLI